MRNDKPKTIYAIHCRPTKRTYIGCCTGFETRIKQHFYELKQGRKWCKVVGRIGNASRAKSDWQLDYDKYGREAFDVYILETDVPATLAEGKELEYVLRYKSNYPEHGYNIRPSYKYPAFEIKQGAPPIPA